MYILYDPGLLLDVYGYMIYVLTNLLICVKENAGLGENTFWNRGWL